RGFGPFFNRLMVNQPKPAHGNVIVVSPAEYSSGLARRPRQTRPMWGSERRSRRIPGPINVFAGIPIGILIVAHHSVPRALAGRTGSGRQSLSGRSVPRRAVMLPRCARVPETPRGVSGRGGTTEARP